MMRIAGWLALGVLAPVFGCTNAKLDLGGTSDAGATPGSSPPAAGAGDVSGVVLSSLGVPVSNISVCSGGVVTVTDAQGRFTIRDAPARYDVAVAMQYPPYDSNAAVFHGVSIYQGLSTRSPVLASQVWAAFTTNATVHVTYPELPAGAQNVVVGDLASRGTWLLWGGLTSGTPATANDVGIPMLSTAPPLDSRIGWLAYTETTTPDGDQVPGHYIGFDRTEMPLQPDSTSAWSPRDGETAERTVTGTVTAAPGQTVYEAYAFVRLSNAGSWAPISVSPVRRAPWSLVVPKIPGVSVAIHYAAYDTGQEGSTGGGESQALVAVADDGTVPPAVLPPPPRLVSPDDGALFGPGTAPLAWEGQGTCIVELSPQQQGGMSYFPWFVVFTRGTSFAMPDLSPLGVVIPDGIPYGWGVTCVQTSEPGPGGDPVLLPPGDLLGTSGYSAPIPGRTILSSP